MTDKTIEEKLNELPCEFYEIFEEKCPFHCGEIYKKRVKYELTIEVRQHDEYKRFRIFYKTSDLPIGDCRRFLGKSSGIGFKTLDEALEDLKGYLNDR
jgi:hypothetical protein